MRRTECLVQVQMNDIEAHRAWRRFAEDGVQVRTVVIKQSAGTVDDFGNLHDVALKQPQRIRIRQHQSGSLVIDCLAQSFEVDQTFSGRRDAYDIEAGDMGTRWIGSMGAVRHENLRALKIAILFMVGSHHHQPGPFAVRSGCRLQRNTVHAGDDFQVFLQFMHQLQRALDGFHWLIGVDIGEAVQTGGHLVDFRVVFHCAGP